MSDDAEIAKKVQAAKEELNRALRQADAAGLKIEIDLVPWHSLQTQNEVTVLHVGVFREVK